MQTKDLLKLSKINYYKSSKSTESLGQLDGNYYVWSAEDLNGRIRIAKTKKDCGIKGKYIGWILLSDLNIVEEVIIEEKPREINKSDSIIHTAKQTIIFLCGLGGSGKSTYRRWLLTNKLQDYNIKLIAIDEIIEELDPNKKYRKDNDWIESVAWQVFLTRLNDTTIKQLHEIVLVEFHDELKKHYKFVMDKLYNKEKYNFIYIYIYPNLHEYIKHHIEITGYDLHKNADYFKKILKLYKSADLPVDDDFANYGFATSKIFIIDNSQDVNQLSIDYLFDYLKTLQ